MFGGSENQFYEKNSESVERAKDSVLDQVSADLNAFLDQANDRQKRLIFLSRKIGIHKKTLQRISSKENSPSYPTVMKLYRFFYNVETDLEILSRAPQVIKDFLNKSFPEKATQISEFSEKSFKVLNNNKAALEIYLMAAIKGLHKSELKSCFGEYGLTIIRQLIDEKLIAESTPDLYTQGAKNFSLPPEMLIHSGEVLTDRFSKPSLCYLLNKNFVGFYGESLNEAAYMEWIKIDQQAMKQKIEIAQRIDSKGSIPAFSFCIVETLINEDFEQ
jgi:DNA-binding phage protein